MKKIFIFAVLLFTSCYYEASEYPDLFDCDEARAVYVLNNVSGNPVLYDTFDNCYYTSENLNFTVSGENDTIITWDSDNVSVIDVDGVITRGAVDQYIDITATFSKNKFGVTREWRIKVLSL